MTLRRWAVSARGACLRLRDVSGSIRGLGETRLGTLGGRTSYLAIAHERSLASSSPQESHLAPQDASALCLRWFATRCQNGWHGT